MPLNIEFKGNPLFYCHALSKDSAEAGRVKNHDLVDGNSPSAPFKLMQKMSLVKNTTENMASFKKIVVIGDSLSDSTGRMRSKTFGLMPSAPQYYDGRFTNGFTWVDILSSPKYMNVDVISKAEGGAVAGNHCKINPAFIFVSSMKKQVEKLKFNGDELAIVSLGSNDYITFNKKNHLNIINDQVKNINKMIKKGAKNIVVVGIPDLSETPFAKKKTQEYRSEIKNISMLHNRILAERVKSAKYDSGVTVKFFDLNKMLDSTMQEAKKLGYNTDDAFHQGYIGGKGILNTSPRYVFNDDVHPTQEVHAIFALQMQAFISEEFRPPVVKG